MKNKRFLVKHVGNMGDAVFLVPPALETLKKTYPDCHITLVTAWGFKSKRRPFPYIRKQDVWGERNQSGFCIALLMTNPHIDQLVHFSTNERSLDGAICHEDGMSFPTWDQSHYDAQKTSGEYDGIFELDMGLLPDGNPMQQVYNALGLPAETYSNYQLYLTDSDKEVAHAVMNALPHPRIVLLESLSGPTTRNWDPEKAEKLTQEIETTYGVAPFWFGSKHIPTYKGRSLTLRENIATLTYCDVGIGVLSGPLHFAAAVGLPTITLYADHPLHRAAPAYFLNEYISDPKRQHRTILGSTNYDNITILKDESTLTELSPSERAAQKYVDWQSPGKQATKSGLAILAVDEIMTALTDVLPTA